MQKTTFIKKGSHKICGIMSLLLIVVVINTQ